VWESLSGIGFDALCARLRSAVPGPLPGIDAQLEMAPGPRRPGWKPGHVPDSCRRAAALLPLYEGRDARPHLVLTLRSSRLVRHSGQVSLPGGALDEGESVERCALREAREEIGLREELVTLVGPLTPLHIPASGFVLSTVVGIVSDWPSFEPDHREVEEVVETPLDVLCDPSSLGRETMQRPGGTLDVPYFRVGKHKVWGATAMILAEFLELLAARRV
jgi:8-oxo-dGTP pyrophosphatase MutT (NUDIX family)